MSIAASKPERSIFVIMPFVSTPSRDQDQLASFFENNIRRPIESADLAFAYRVRRSGESFNISEEIIRDLFRADIVIADLSGIFPNPNVMYELGVRLALSNEPVILIRERNPDNKTVFDVSTYYTLPYDPLNYPALEKSLVEKLRRLESGEDPYESPIFRTLRGEFAVTRAASRLTPDQQRALIVQGARATADSITRTFGPQGVGMAFSGEGGVPRILYSGAMIANNITVANPLEQEGVATLARVANSVEEEYGDGSKTGILIAAKLMEAGASAIARGNGAREVVQGVTEASTVALSVLEAAAEYTFPEDRQSQVALSAARDQDIAGLATDVFTMTGPDDIVWIEESDSGPDDVVVVEGMQIDRGLASKDLTATDDIGPIILEDCYILLYPGRISSMYGLLPIANAVARLNHPLLIVADQIDVEALATLVVNNRRGTLRCMAIRGMGERQLELLDDIAAYSGGIVLTEQRGFRIENAVISDLGRAERIEVDRNRTVITGGHADELRVASRAEALRREIKLHGDSAEAHRLRTRLARLVGKSVTVAIGGSSANQIRDRQYRFRSSLNSLRVAARSGLVTGGGVAYLGVRSAVSAILRGDPAFDAGVQAVLAALEQPTRRLTESAGLSSDDVIRSISSRSNVGLNVQTRQIETLGEQGVVDALGVVQGALRAAVAHARDFLETSTWNLGTTQSQTSFFTG